MLKQAEKRVFFKKREQQKFISQYLGEKGLTISQLSSRLGINSRTLRDGKREKYSMSFKAYQHILKHSKNNSILARSVKPPF